MSEESNYCLPHSLAFELANQARIDILKSIMSPNELRILWACDNDALVIKDLVEHQNVLVIDPNNFGGNQFINQVLLSLLATKKPSELKLVIADSIKGDFEVYQSLDKHFLSHLPGEVKPILKEPIKVLHTIRGLCTEIGIRKALLEEAGVHTFQEYNHKFNGKKLDPLKGHQCLPQIVFMLADIGPYSAFIRRQLFYPLQKVVVEGPLLGLHCIIGFSQIYGDTLFNRMLHLIPNQVIFNLKSINKYKIFFDGIKQKPALVKGNFISRNETGIKTSKTVAFSDEEVMNVCKIIALQPPTKTSLILPEALEDIP